MRFESKPATVLQAQQCQAVHPGLGHRARHKNPCIRGELGQQSQARQGIKEPMCVHGVAGGGHPVRHNAGPVSFESDWRRQTKEPVRGVVAQPFEAINGFEADLLAVHQSQALRCQSRAPVLAPKNRPGLLLVLFMETPGQQGVLWDQGTSLVLQHDAPVELRVAGSERLIHGEGAQRRAKMLRAFEGPAA